MAETSSKKPGFFSKVKNWFKGIGKFLRDTVSEMKKVVWPTKKQVVNNTIVVIVVSFTAIASFIVPNESFGAVFRLLKFLFIFAAALWGIYGYLLLFAALLFHLAQLESFGVPYMLPSVCGGHLDYDGRKDEYVRYPLRCMRKRPLFTREGRRIRQKRSWENQK